MFRWLLGTCLLGLLMASHGTAGEVVSLFNGKDLTGWQTFVDPGKNVKPAEIWTIDEGVIRCRGHVNGYLLSEKEYENYKLRFQWRWGDEVARGRNSGVFVHVVGPNQIWPKGYEGQLAHEHAGDFWLVDGAQLNIDQARQDKKTPRHYYRMKDQVEKPLGQWNQYEVVCQGDRVELHINGQLVNVGTDAELTSGRILFQSEGAEIHFRNIELEPLD